MRVKPVFQSLSLIQSMRPKMNCCTPSSFTSTPTVPDSGDTADTKPMTITDAVPHHHRADEPHEREIKVTVS